MNIPVSILDTDLYTLTMQNAICKLFPRSEVQFRFFNRGKHDFPDGFADELRRIVQEFRGMRLAKREKEFLREKVYFLDPIYLDLLESFKFNPEEVKIQQGGSKLHIDIIGPWYSTIMWEEPLMAMICELYYEMKGLPAWSEEMQTKHNQEKIQGLREIGVRCSEFGTRRRHSFAVHNNFLSDVAEYGRDVFTGTSNVFLAMEYGLTPVGTQAHQFTQWHAAQFGYRMANYMAMENWVNVYNGDLGIALPDTFTTEVFLRSFDPKFAKLFDGGRQDSGDPITFTDVWVEHYRKLRINPAYKTIIYSDSLKDHETIARIHHHAQQRGINDGYGIGTWCTNDVGQLPLNIVIKMTGCKVGGIWVPVVKLSDDVGKNTGESDEIANCKKQLRIKE